jgi:hypothetical protein
MTARDRLNRRMRPAGIAMYGAVCLLLIGTAIEVVGNLDLELPLVLAFGMLCLISMATQVLLFRCHRCLGNMAPILWWRGGLKIDQRVCFCPFCGVSLDQELPEGSGDLVGVNA